MIIKVKTAKSKQPITHNGVTRTSQNSRGDVILEFGPGMADVVYPHKVWTKFDRVQEG